MVEAIDISGPYSQGTPPAALPISDGGALPPAPDAMDFASATTSQAAPDAMDIDGDDGGSGIAATLDPITQPPLTLQAAPDAMDIDGDDGGSGIAVALDPITQPPFTLPPAPDAMVIDGERPPSASGPIPYEESTQVTHNDPVPAGQHAFVNVGSRAAAVDIALPATPAAGQNVYVSDGSGQADQYGIRVAAAAGHTIDEYAEYVLRNRYAVLHLRFDGNANWKVI